MTRRGPVRVGLIGAGSISEQYLATLGRAPDVEVAFVADLDGDRARTRAAEFGVPDGGSVEDLLLTPGLELAVNLTIPAAHREVTEGALDAGLHVWSEKPLALGTDGADLVRYADRAGLRLGCAPDTMLGRGQQAARRLIGDGAIGRPVSAVVLVQNPGPESWHPSPEFLFDHGAGPLFDLGPYYLTALIHHLGPIARVTAKASTARTTRTIGSGPRAGAEFDVRVPTQYSALLEFVGGANAVMVTSFESEIERSLFEITGSHGSIVPPDPTQFGGSVALHPADGGMREISAGSGPDFTRGVGVVEMARAIRAGRAPRADGRLALHILDAMLAIDTASREGTTELTTTVEVGEALPGDWDPEAATL